jgi:hypothetical protein
MADWGTDELTQFLESAHHVQRCNHQKFAEPYSKMQRIDNCFVRAGKNLVNPNPVLTGVLFLRSQYAYKTAVGMTLAGQAAETFVMLRSCLEYAGYALAMFADPALEVVFANRHVDDASMKAQKEKFQIGAIRTVIAGFDSKLAEIFHTNYSRAIDFGGHPNPHATFSTMELEPNNSILTLSMTNEPKVLLHAMKSAAQSGLTALFIFQHIFKAKFELLGIRAEMDALRREHL